MSEFINKIKSNQQKNILIKQFNNSNEIQLNQYHEQFQIKQQQDQRIYIHNNNQENEQCQKAQQQGFSAEHLQQQNLVSIKKQPLIPTNSILSPHCYSNRYAENLLKQPKLKLTFIKVSSKPQQSQSYYQNISQTLKRSHHQSQIIKSLNQKNKKISLSLPNSNQKEQALNECQRLINNCLVKINRNYVGGNLMINNYSWEEIKRIKTMNIEKGNSLVYQLIRQKGTYAYLGLIKDKICGGMKNQQQEKESSRQNKLENKNLQQKEKIQNQFKQFGHREYSSKISSQQRKQKIILNTPKLSHRRSLQLPPSTFSVNINTHNNPQYNYYHYTRNNNLQNLQNLQQKFTLFNYPENYLIKHKIKQSFIRPKQNKYKNNYKNSVNLTNKQQQKSLQPNSNNLKYLNSLINKDKSKNKRNQKNNKEKNNEQAQFQSEQHELIFDGQIESGNLQLVFRVNNNIGNNNTMNNLTPNNLSSPQKYKTQAFNNSNILVTSLINNKNIHQQNKKNQLQQNIIQYDIYLKSDTNTHGHQNWFYFKTNNTNQNHKTVKFNIVNVKRYLNLIENGEKIFMKKIQKEKINSNVKGNNNKEVSIFEWKPAGRNITIKQNTSNTGYIPYSVYKSKTYTFSFQLDLQPLSEYQISLLPPYTYTQLLYDINKIIQIQNHSRFSKVQNLTYSLIGLAIPIITFTNFQKSDQQKQVVLISGRVHPGETNASYMIKGLIDWLLTAAEANKIIKNGEKNKYKEKIGQHKIKVINKEKEFILSQIKKLDKLANPQQSNQIELQEQRQKQKQRQKQILQLQSELQKQKQTTHSLFSPTKKASVPLTKRKPTLKTSLTELLDTMIIIIIPMINPDGVVFGNFRTNFLGYDLNRSFQSEDQITNPQIVALKELGKNLKDKYGDRFTTFIDMHGHSSQKNIFTYGPDYEQGNQNFYKARFLPKLLNSKSPYFKYSGCTFRLEQYKQHTARGYFLNSLNIPSYTIQSSYAIYQNGQKNNKEQLLAQKQWLSFGRTLGSALQLMNRLKKLYSIKNRTQLKKVISISQEEIMNSMIKNIKKQMKIKNQALITLSKRNSVIQLNNINQSSQNQHPKSKQKSPNNTNTKKDNNSFDSDGQGQTQDLNVLQRQQMQKKLAQNNNRNTRSIILPKVFKPCVQYPTVTPKLFHIGDQSNSAYSVNYKVLYTRRNRYHSIKIPSSTSGVSNNYNNLNNNLIQSVQGLEHLKPRIRNIIPQKKIIEY